MNRDTQWTNTSIHSYIDTQNNKKKEGIIVMEN